METSAKGGKENNQPFLDARTWGCPDSPYDQLKLPRKYLGRALFQGNFWIIWTDFFVWNLANLKALDPKKFFILFTFAWYNKDVIKLITPTIE